MSKAPKDRSSISTITPTMVDVAHALNIHHTTVSRALRNDPRISEQVRKQVKATAEKLGYRPNPLLSVLGTLRRKRATTPYITPIACVSRHYRFSPEHLKGIVSAANERGFKVEVFVIDEKLSAERLNTILLTRNIQGIILAPLLEAHGHFTLDWDRFCTVAIEYSFDTPAFDRVVTDSSEAMNRAIDQCRRRELSSLGVCLAQVVDERNEGLLCASYALTRERFQDLNNLPPLILPTWDEKTFTSWLRRHQPQVIISSNALLPMIQSTLRKLKIRVPRDIGIINLNILDSNSQLSGISQDAAGMGVIATRLLIDKIYRNETGVPTSRVTVLTESHWQDGQSLPSIKFTQK